MNCNSLYGAYRNVKFTDVWEKVEGFLNDIKQSNLNVMSDETLTTLYYLLYANYANSVIASSDINQFKYKVYSTIFMYGPSWEKRLDVQKKIRSLTEDEILTGGKTIYNHAFNPDTKPSTSTLGELLAINDQNTANYRKSKLEGYSLLIGLIETDVTKEFIDKFKKLFLTVVQPEETLLYEVEER